MKALIIGGNRFVGLRLAHLWDQRSDVELHILNRTGQAAHIRNATIFKCDRRNLDLSHLDRTYDVVVDFATYNDRDARCSLDYFDHVGRYILISTVAVYDDGEWSVETDLDPAAIDLTRPESPPQDPSLAYQWGKRRAEAVLAQQSRFPSVFVRFPYIVGIDDYTDRLRFHVRRIQNGQPLSAPAWDTRFSLINSKDACSFLDWASAQNFIGAINAASPNTVSLREVLDKISEITGRRAILLSQPTKESLSPYGESVNRGMDTSRMLQLGFQIPPTSEWLEKLIADLVEQPSGPRVH